MDTLRLNSWRLERRALPISFPSSLSGLLELERVGVLDAFGDRRVSALYLLCCSGWAEPSSPEPLVSLSAFVDVSQVICVVGSGSGAGDKLMVEVWTKSKQRRPRMDGTRCIRARIAFPSVRHHVTSSSCFTYQGGLGSSSGLLLVCTGLIITCKETDRNTCLTDSTWR